MSDEQQQQQQRQNCCRLCLAPDNECISILNSYAADKEPLATKIYSCVSVKVSLDWAPQKYSEDIECNDADHTRVLEWEKPICYTC